MDSNMSKGLALAALLATLAVLPQPAQARPLYTELALPGETMDEFIVRIAPRARAYTMEHGVEICGAIGTRDNGTMTVLVGTDDHPMVCKIRRVDGKYSGYVFHTHTHRGSEYWTNEDLRTPGYLVTPQKLMWQNKNKMRRLVDY